MLAEVVVKGKGQMKLKPFHYDKANGVAKGVVLVPVREDNLSTALLIVRVSFDLGNQVEAVSEESATYSGT